jgi:hypothetical protein
MGSYAEVQLESLYTASEQGDLSLADPTLKGTKPYFALKIELGIYMTDEKLSFKKRIDQLISRFTWELPNTIVGRANAFYHFNRFNINRVEYVRGATVLSTPDDMPGYFGVSIGNYIIGTNIFDDPQTLHHEYGHYLQGQKVGPFYLLFYGLPSGKWQDKKVEGDAYDRGNDYFNGNYGNKEYYYSLFLKALLLRFL